MNGNLDLRILELRLDGLTDMKAPLRRAVQIVERLAQKNELRFVHGDHHPATHPTSVSVCSTAVAIAAQRSGSTAGHEVGELRERRAQQQREGESASSTWRVMVRRP